MATREKKKPTKKKKSKSSGIGSYIRKIQNNPAVKRQTAKIKKLMSTLAAEKKKKVSAVKAARKKLK